MAKQSRPYLILGTGGHAKVVAATLLAEEQTILGFIDPAPQFDNWQGIPCLGGDDLIEEHKPDTIYLANGLGSLPGNSSIRERLYQQFAQRAYEFPPIIHPKAYLAPGVNLQAGVQVMAGCIIQVDTRVGENTIINTGAQIDHDCNIGAHCHIAPGACLSGNIILASNVHIGTGANVIQALSVGAHSVIGAGVTVTRNIETGVTVYPAPTTTKRSDCD